MKLKYLLFLLICFTQTIHSNPDSLINNMFPLHTGNQYQRFSVGSFLDGSSCSMGSTSVIKDTSVNGIKYYALNNTGDFYRYDPDSNKAYVWYNNVEGLYIDFSLPSGSYFTWFHPRTNSSGSVRLYKDSVNLFGKRISRISWTAYMGGSFTEYFGEGFGILGHKDGSTYGTVTSTLINAILYDSNGNFVYYSDKHKPSITFTPFYHLQSKKKLNFSVQVNHFFNCEGSHLGQPVEGVVYIDSVYLLYYYEKDNKITPIKKSAAFRLPVSVTYKFDLNLDSALLGSNYKFKYKIVAKDKAFFPEFSSSPEDGYYEATYEPTSSVIELNETPSFYLDQNYPNPFNPSTKISFNLSTESRVSLKVYDLLGREAAELVNNNLTAGEHTIDFNASNLASGMYTYKLTAASSDGQIFITSKKMILSK